MTQDISDIVYSIKNATDSRDLLLDYTALLSQCQYPERQGDVLRAIQTQDAFQSIGYLFDITSRVKGYEYLKSLADTLYKPPQKMISLVPLSERTKEIYLLRKPEPISTKWKILSRTMPEEIVEFLKLYGAEYGIEQEIRKKKSCLAFLQISTAGSSMKDISANSPSI